jgi:hypothetical protein
MNQAEQNKILTSVKIWFENVIVPNHISNTKKLVASEEFNINPFLAPYLAGFLTGQLDPKSVANALILPRVLGTSITTSFGQNMQSFISDVLSNTIGSLVPGIDIEFIDTLDGRRKYCQAKLGPNTINADDVDTIHNHFKATRNLGRTNNAPVQHGDLVVGILYGEIGQESGHYKRLSDEFDYPIYIGEEFWHRLTGNKEFYQKLQQTIAEVAVEARGFELIKEVTEKLSKTEAVRKLAGMN